MDANYANTIKGRAPLRASAKIRQALAQRGKGVGTISYAYSPKTHRDVVLASDLELCHFLSLEGRPDVETYDLDPDRIIAHLGEDGYCGSKPDADIKARSGRRLLAEVKYERDAASDVRASLQFQAQQQEAARIGADWYLYTDRQAREEERFILDWLQIVVTLSASGGTRYKRLERDVISAVERAESMTLLDLHHRRFDAWDIVFTCIFQLSQRGQLIDNVRKEPLSWSTAIRCAKWA